MFKIVLTKWYIFSCFIKSPSTKHAITPTFWENHQSWDVTMVCRTIGTAANNTNAG
jgi:hypothetical protein